MLEIKDDMVGDFLYDYHTGNMYYITRDKRFIILGSQLVGPRELTRIINASHRQMETKGYVIPGFHEFHRIGKLSDLIFLSEEKILRDKK